MAGRRKQNSDNLLLMLLLLAGTVTLFAAVAASVSATVFTSGAARRPPLTTPTDVVPTVTMTVVRATPILTAPATETATATPAFTPSLTATHSPSPTATATPTQTATATETATPTVSATATLTPTATATPCAPLTLDAFEVNDQDDGTVRIEWETTGGCEPFRVLVTRERLISIFGSDAEEYRFDTPDGNEETAAGLECGESGTFIYRILAVDSSGQDDTTFRLAGVSGTCPDVPVD